mmetsp:Transcript_11383/g.28284  ORF Transcript_11383/g.28284 Transcript_11383/m.28284 type:complete len:278 (+) Transcript_11383:116-949(+)
MSARYATVDDFIRHTSNVAIIDKLRDKILAATKDAECKNADRGCKALEKVRELLNSMVDVGSILKVNSAILGTRYGIILTRRTDKGERTILYNNGRSTTILDFKKAEPATLEDFISATSDPVSIEGVGKRMEKEIEARKKAKKDYQAFEEVQALLDSKIVGDFEQCDKIPVVKERGVGSWVEFLLSGDDGRDIRGMGDQSNPCLCAYAGAGAMKDTSVHFDSIKNYKAGQLCDDFSLQEFRGELDSQSGGLRNEDKTKIFDAFCEKVATADTKAECH